MAPEICLVSWFSKWGNVDPDPQSSWIRIQFGFGSTTLVSTRLTIHPLVTGIELLESVNQTQSGDTMGGFHRLNCPCVDILFPCFLIKQFRMFLKFWFELSNVLNNSISFYSLSYVLVLRGRPRWVIPAWSRVHSRPLTISYSPLFIRWVDSKTGASIT